MCSLNDNWITNLPITRVITIKAASPCYWGYRNYHNFFQGPSIMKYRDQLFTCKLAFVLHVFTLNRVKTVICSENFHFTNTKLCTERYSCFQFPHFEYGLTENHFQELWHSWHSKNLTLLLKLYLRCEKKNYRN